MGTFVRVGAFFAGVVGRCVTLDSVVRNAVIEVRSSESRDNWIRSDTPLRVDLEVLLLG